MSLIKIKIAEFTGHIVYEALDYDPILEQKYKNKYFFVKDGVVTLSDNDDYRACDYFINLFRDDITSSFGNRGWFMKLHEKNKPIFDKLSPYNDDGFNQYKHMMKNLNIVIEFIKKDLAK